MLVSGLSLELRRPFPRIWVNDLTDIARGLTDTLHAAGAGLSDCSLNPGSPSLADAAFKVLIRDLGATLVLSLESIVIQVTDVELKAVPRLIAIFDQANSKIPGAGTGGSLLVATLSFHLAGSGRDLADATVNLVDKKKMGEGEFFGVARYRSNDFLSISRSQEHETAAFVVVQHRTPGSAGAAIQALIDGQAEALRMLSANV